MTYEAKVAQLRKKAEFFKRMLGDGQNETYLLLREAADAIETLSTKSTLKDRRLAKKLDRIAGLNALLDTAAATITKLQEENDRLDVLSATFAAAITEALFVGTELKTVKADVMESLEPYTEMSGQALLRAKAEAWDEAAQVHRAGIVTHEWHKWPENPYRGNTK